ncbi:MAG: tRNA pseudouridine(55) synthase TruB [Clostridiales bacterium]|jgi:tRNA pseudouridine55 synthase|nr:tRNA pseudouridine(55) synthase TruB [Clostridiales bacterium]
MELNGIVNIYKEQGYTSFDVVAKIKRHLRVKAGHTGTLDPMAEGVLPVCLDKSTRLAQFITAENKAYRTVFRLGVKTDTLDMTGLVVNERPVNVTGEDIKNAVMGFVGEISQIPPMYSAIKVNGQRLYDMARKGIEIERKPRNIKIYSIDITDISLPLVTMNVSCSKGTYIRTLIDDIGEVLGCGAAMEALTRTKSGSFDISGAIRLDELFKAYDNGEVERFVIKPDVVLIDYPIIRAKAMGDKAIKNGNPLNIKLFMEYEELIPGGKYRLYNNTGIFIGLYIYIEENECFKPCVLLTDLTTL